MGHEWAKWACYSFDMSSFELPNDDDDETKLSCTSFQTVVEVFLRSRYGAMSLLLDISTPRHRILQLSDSPNVLMLRRLVMAPHSRPIRIADKHQDLILRLGPCEDRICQDFGLA